MSNMYIVGGTGYIGQHMKTIYPNAVYTGTKDFDLLNKDEIANFFKDKIIDTCIFLSAKISFNDTPVLNEEPFLTNNVGLSNLLSVFKEKNLSPKIIYFSSMTVYDSNNFSPVSEESNLLPLHDYGLSKVLAENILKFYGFKSLIIRIPEFSGGKGK